MSLFKEVLFASRSLLKSPIFTFTAITALALGIGVNTAIFSVANAFLLKPVNVPRLSRMMTIFQTSPGGSSEWEHLPAADFRDLQSQTRSFQSLAAYRLQDINLSADAHPELVSAAQVTDTFFNTLGVQPELGHAAIDREVVLSHNLWTRRFQADPHILGKTLRLNSANYKVAGVMPESFNFPVATDLYLPLTLTTTESANRTDQTLRVIGRLKDNVSTASAALELANFSRSLEQQFPDTHRGWRTSLISLREFVTGPLLRQYTELLVGATLLVLLIACANVANLQFARAISRQKELAVHGALGASRFRILRQLLTESLLLSLAAGIVAIAVGQISLAIIVWYMPATVASFISGWDRIVIDWSIFGCTIALAALAGMISGIAPAIQFSSVDPGAALKEGTRGSSQGRATDRARAILLVFELALSLVLLICAGIMVQSARAFSNVGAEMHPEQVLTVEFAPLDFKNQTRYQAADFYTRALQNTASIAGVQAAALSTQIPFNDPGLDASFTIEGNPKSQTSETPAAYLQAVSPGALEMMHSALIAGRRIDSHDGVNSAPVAVVSQRLADRFFPHQDALGHRIQIKGFDAAVTIVGVTGNLSYNLFQRQPHAVIYVPYTQHPTPSTFLTIRTTGDPDSLIAAIRQRFLAIAPDQPLSRFRTIATVRHESAIGINYVGVMLTVSGILAFGLACIGIYGVVAYAVAQRTREIGIRVSLGANAATILTMVMRRNIVVIGVGLAIGLAASITLVRALAPLIFGVDALDPIVFGGVTLCLAIVAAIASLIPAMRVLGIEPNLALRSE